MTPVWDVQRPAVKVMVLLTATALFGEACQPGAQATAHPSAFASTSASASASMLPALHFRFIYAAQSNGVISVYDIDHGHRLVDYIHAFSCCADVRGAAAAAPTHRFYVMYNRDGQGHVLALDLLSNAVLWDKVLHSPGVDRGNLTPDGKTLYLPTWEGDALSLIHI